MSTYKLHYFNARGRGEISRLIFAAAGQKYEDIRFEREQWPSIKSRTPLGQVPFLEVNGVQLPQSMTIARFLAKQFQLAGKNNFEQAQVDAIIDTINDIVNAFIPVRGNVEQTKKFLSEELPKHLRNLEVLYKLYGNGGKFFVGGNLTWADLLFYDLGQTILGLDANSLDKNPWLKQNRAEVEKQPNIAAYLKKRPQTDF